MIQIIYTSYFAKIRKLPKEIVTISICGKSPIGYKGYQYKKLAPKIDFFLKWKENHDNDFYVKEYTEKVIDKLKPNEVNEELYTLINKPVNSCDISLICFEKSEDFCHRHLISKWFNENDIKCYEFYEQEKFENEQLTF